MLDTRPTQTGAGVFLTALLVFGSGWAIEPDYLSRDLRAAVEQLKAEVASVPTTPASFQARSRILWDWANAFAVHGGYVPVNLTAATRPEIPDQITARAARGLDDFIRELALADDEPEALGALTADLGPFEARSHATFQQTWTVGSRAVTRGGGFVIAKHFNADHGAYQTEDPAVANYVSLSTTAEDARFVADERPLDGMHGGFRGSAPVLYFRLDGGRLTSGDTVTVTYGARGGGGPGLLMPSLSSDRMPFPLYVAFDGASQLYSLPIQPIVVSGSMLDGVAAFAPSVVRPGEPFTVSVRAQDKYYNRALPPYPGWRVYANEMLLGELTPGAEPIRLLEGVRLDTPGAYRLSVRASDGSVTGAGNPILVSTDAERIYWGDSHGHSGFAEGIGTPERFMTWAKDDARLDWVTHSEHDIWMDDHEWQVLKDVVTGYSEEGRFIAYLGYEWTAHFRHGGHHNVLFRTAEGRERIPTQFYPVLSDLYAGLRAKHDPRDVVVIPHAHNPGDYRMSDPKLEPLVEIMSQHGTFEWFGRMYLSHGHQVGFTAASDNHLSQPGYTAPKGLGLSQRGGLGAIRAPQLTRDAIFDAMKSLDAYATTGERMILDVRLNGEPMGRRIPFAGQRKITGRVIGTAPVESVTLVKNDEVIWQKDYLLKDEGQFNPEETFYLRFDSESVPLQRRDAPRGWRPWRGQLEVTGAELIAVTPTDFFNADVNQLDVDGNVVRFRTATRGDASSLALVLRNIKRGARISLDLEPAREHGSAPPVFRPPADLPGSSFTLALADLEHGQLKRRLPFEIYEDTVTLRRHITVGVDDVSFEIEDEGSVQGDYYFVRVKQVDDAMAWSSPIWVGGFEPR
jgi:hypothetical protein